MDHAQADLVKVSDCRYGRMMFLKNDRYLGRALAHYGEYSEGEVDFWRRFIQPEWVCVDAGANIGCHTLALARLATRGHVLACEPLPYIYHLLCGNVALNALTHVTTLNVALGAERGMLYVPAIDYTMAQSYGGLPLGQYEEGRRIAILKLDDLLPMVHFLKADVEGMEQQVLQGASRLITECRPVLYVENNPPSEKQQPLIDYIHGIGYDLWWHQPPLFNPANYRHSMVDDEPGVVSFNMLGLPADIDAEIVGPGLTKIERLNVMGPS